MKECAIDPNPEAHSGPAFSRASKSRIWLADPNRRDRCHERVPDRPDRCNINRTEARDEMVASFHNQKVLLPRGARQLGGRVKEGLGEYYRELLAPQRTLEKDAQENRVGRWVDNGKADHFAHAEAYCMLAMDCLPAAILLGDAREIFGGRRTGANDRANPW